MKEYKEIEEIIEVEIRRTCNKCGKYVEEDLDTITPLCFTFEYGSNHDFEQWSFDLCDECLEEIVREFKIPITVINGWT